MTCLQQQSCISEGRRQPDMPFSRDRARTRRPFGTPSVLLWTQIRKKAKHDGDGDRLKRIKILQFDDLISRVESQRRNNDLAGRNQSFT